MKPLRPGGENHLEPFKPDDTIMVWRVPVPSKGGKWVGPGVVIQTHHSIVWTSMRGSLWKCANIQCKLAADDESRGLEIQNALLLDLRAELNDNRGRKTYVDVTRERPPEAADSAAPAQTPKPPAAVQHEDVQVIGEAPIDMIPENEEAIIPEENPMLRPAPLNRRGSLASTALPNDGCSARSAPPSQESAASEEQPTL